jgi:hypothetical protein
MEVKAKNSVSFRGATMSQRSQTSSCTTLADSTVRRFTVFPAKLNDVAASQSQWAPNAATNLQEVQIAS